VVDCTLRYFLHSAKVQQLLSATLRTCDLSRLAKIAVVGSLQENGMVCILASLAVEVLVFHVLVSVAALCFFCDVALLWRQLCG
jgi:hypothetical protein